MREIQAGVWARVAALTLLAFCVVVLGANLFHANSFSAVVGAAEGVVPKFKFDPDWPKPLPNKWKIGGITGLAVDKDDNVWVYDRPERSDRY